MKKPTAIEALRQWSIPGRRADLVAEAWRDGETRITALAEAARTTRTTVYADLKSRGIDPEDRPKGTPMTTLVTIDGMTGIDADHDHQVIQEAQERYLKEHPGGAGANEALETRLAARITAYAYNTLATTQAAEQSARRDRDRALHLVEVRWEALSTATAWHAAHHAYVVAVDAARTAITAWSAAAHAAAKAGWFPAEMSEQLYRERILTAGHPPVELYGLDADAVDAEAARLRDALDQAHEHRARLAGQTLTAAPAGDER
ncbi:hypothetical protein ACIGHB_29980 [Streptomyces sp. NPDC085460]|uniref:hypothetical protein n=1 Tax=Streptomyces sp. NPDC085460 TaxID=3365723 RepID=UPI0037CFAD6C